MSMTVNDSISEMLEAMKDGGEEPGEWRAGRNAYNELLKLDYFIQGSPPTILGIPVVYDEKAKPDMLYLMSSRWAKEISAREIKTKHGKTIKLPKWGL